MNPSDLTAIDVHVHLEHQGEATAADAAAKQYFGAGAQADWNALADYYRSRKIGCVVFTVDEKITGRPQVSNDAVAEFAADSVRGQSARDRPHQQGKSPGRDAQQPCPIAVLGNTADRAHQAVDRAKESAAPALGKVADAAHRTIDKAAEKATPAAQWVSDSSRQMVSKSGEVAEACGNYVRAHPFGSVAGALVIGYFVAKMLR